MDQVYIPQKDYKVLVRCMTYNQSKYIEDALNGFAMQQTDFPYVCLVMDDCSTDGEQDVIKAWMERECDMAKAESIEIEKSFITIVHHRTNLNCQFAFYFLKENLYKKGGKAPMIAPWREHCEYEALCEGDDYWISLEKLQKQVEFLDVNKEYSMCFHNAKVKWEDNSRSESLFANIETKEYSPKALIKTWITPTASMLMKVHCSYISKELNIDNSKIIYGDSLLKLCCLNEGKVYGFNEVMSVYRKQPNGAVYNRSFEQKKRYIRQLIYCRSVFPKFKNELNACLAVAEFDFSLHLASNRQFTRAIGSYIKSIMYSPKECMNSTIAYIKAKR